MNTVKRTYFQRRVLFFVDTKNMQQNFNIQDSSGDKDFFTIVPNYILNHSTAIDQALYLQLKRLSGDGRKDYCYPSVKYLLKQLGVGKPVLRKSFKYLIEHKWIEDLGKRQVHTAGGLQWVNAYKVNNIWDVNNEYYKGGSNRHTLSKEGTKDTKGGLKTSKGGTASQSIRRTYKERNKDNFLKVKENKPYFVKGQGWIKPFKG